MQECLRNEHNLSLANGDELMSAEFYKLYFYRIELKSSQKCGDWIVSSAEFVQSVLLDATAEFSHSESIMSESYVETFDGYTSRSRMNVEAGVFSFYTRRLC